MPRRRCVGCGRIAPKSELLRVAAVEGDGSASARAVLDPAKRMPGRGAYLCHGAIAAQPSADCLAQATRRGGIARALRRSIAGDLALDEAKLLESVSR
ncbi:MAG TPA: YlxR family protein [Solirubrobacteraceae bacterium]|nr:YlxR family protein [Solirubrobacteraceae bacterium]